jgi:hypothetical protein
VEWVARFEGDWLFARVPWLHPWRFACAPGVLVGCGLALAQLQAGFPPSLTLGLLAGIVVAWT